MMIIAKSPQASIISMPQSASSPPNSFHYSQRRTSLPSLYSDGCSETSALYTSILSGIRNQIAPQVFKEGDNAGGVYLLKDISNNPAAIFKPQDEESIPSEQLASLGAFPVGKEIKEGLVYGEGYLKEIATFLLDQDHFHNVPPTALFHCAHPLFYKDKFLAKTGSLQKYVPHMCTSEDVGWNAFPIDEVHKIGILDCRILNNDRHMGNILVVKSGASYRLVPIDHGMCLPSSFSGGYFEWMSFPQSKKPFSQEVLSYIKRMDVDTDIRMLKKQLPNLRYDCLKTLKVCTIFLQKGAKHGMTLHQIGTHMTRYRCTDIPCDLERIVDKVEQRVERRREREQEQEQEQAQAQVKVQFKVFSERSGSGVLMGGGEYYYWEYLEEEINTFLKRNP